MCKHTHFWYLFCAKIHIFGRCKSFGADYFCDENRLVDAAYEHQRGEGMEVRRTERGISSNGLRGAVERSCGGGEKVSPLRCELMALTETDRVNSASD